MDNRLLIEARNCAVAIQGDRIVEPEGHFATVLRFPDADLRPGLINAHEHLHRNHYGRLGAPPYIDAYEWAFDIQRRCRREIAAGRTLPRREALLAGAWKNLFAGVTTVVHHDRWEPDFDDDFPLRVVRVPCVDGLGMVPDLCAIAQDRPFCIHLAEGTGPLSSVEVDQLDARGLLGEHCLAVHCVGLTNEGVERFRTSGAAVVWCPTSNLFLFGRTAADELLSEGVDVLVGSDSLLTSSGNLLDELREARLLNSVSDKRLIDAVGATAARRLGIEPVRLQPGDPADIAILSRPLLQASARDVEFVMVGGVPRVARPDLESTLRQAGWRGSELTIAGVTRWTAAIPVRDAMAAPMNYPHPSRPLIHEDNQQIAKQGSIRG